MTAKSSLIRKLIEKIRRWFGNPGSAQPNRQCNDAKTRDRGVFVI